MKFLPTVLFFLFPLSIFTQAPAREPEVFGSAGGFSANVGSFSLSFTVGEAVIATLEPANQNFLLSQGFQQPSFKTIIGTSERLPEGWSVLTYPNPASGQLYFRLDAPGISSADLSVWDVSGRLALAPRKIAANTLHQLVIGDLPIGLYLLYVQAGPGQQYTCMFIKSGR